jgi:uncharacterized membrane protein YvlD (DUF360 family)
VRWLIRIALSLGANAIALLIAALTLDNFEISAGGFVVVLVIFSLLSLFVRPIIIWAVARFARPLLGVVALVATFLILLITDLVSDSIEIEGVTTWILATLIVWLATVVYEIFDDMLIRKLRPGPA